MSTVCPYPAEVEEAPVRLTPPRQSLNSDDPAVVMTYLAWNLSNRQLRAFVRQNGWSKTSRPVIDVAAIRRFRFRPQLLQDQDRWRRFINRPDCLRVVMPIIHQWVCDLINTQ